MCDLNFFWFSISWYLLILIFILFCLYFILISICIFIYLFIYLFIGHEETGRHLFGRKINRILKRWDCVFRRIARILFPWGNRLQKGRKYERKVDFPPANLGGSLREVDIYMWERKKRKRILGIALREKNRDWCTRVSKGFGRRKELSQSCRISLLPIEMWMLANQVRLFYPTTLKFLWIGMFSWDMTMFDAITDCLDVCLIVFDENTYYVSYFQTNL